MSTGFSRTWSIRTLAVVLLGAIVVGCLDHAVTGPDHSNGVNFASRLVVLDGNMQSGAVNSALPTPVKLRVTDINGSPVAGASVAFSLRSGGGSLSPFSATSAADGSVSTVWTLGTALGENKVVAILSGAFVVDSATLTATGTNGPAAKLAIDAGDNQHAPIGTVLPAAVSTLVTDNYGNPVPGAAVTYAVTGGGSHIDLVRTTSDANGKISANWTLGTTAGLQTATASLANGTSISYRAVADAGLPVQIIQESGSGQTGTVGHALAAPVSIRVVDAYGNNVRGVSVSWIADDGTISASSATTDTLGRSQGRWVLGNRAGTQSASVSVTGLSAVNVVAIAQAAVPFQVNLETGDKQTQTVGQTLPLPLVAKIVDQFGNGVAGFPITWNAASGGGSLLATLATSDNTGRSTAIWTLGTTAGSQLATLAVTGLPLTVYSATATAASGDSVVIEAGNNQSGTVSTALGTPLIIRVRDTSGNPVVGTTVVFAVASGGGSVTPAVAVTDANGRAQAAWTLGSFAGAQTVTATVGAKSVTFIATGAAVGGGGGGGGILTPTQLVLVSGNGQNGSVGQTLGTPIVVQVIDASGVPVTGVNVTWTLAVGNSGGFASPTVSRTDGGGNASLLWTLGSKVGLQQVTASVTGLTPVTLQATAQIGSSGAIIIDNGNGQTGAIGAALLTNLRVLVVDQSGTPVIGARVNWSVATGGGTLSKSSGLTDVNGNDNVAWTLGTTAGTQTVTATVTGVGAVTFTATAGGSISINAGNGQSGTVSAQLASDFQVKVTGPTGTVIPGVTVNWAVTVGGGTLSKSTGITDASGLDATRLTLGASAGTNTVTATVVGLGTVSFNSTASTVLSTPASIVKISGDGQTARSGQTLASPLIVEVRDAAGSPLASVPVTFSVTTLTGGSVAPTPVLTGVDGRASASWTLSTNSGTAVVTDQVQVTAGAAPAVTFSALVRPALRIRWIVGGTSAASPLMTDTTGATLSDTLEVQVYDPTGGATLGVGGQLVTWRTLGGEALDGVAVNSVVSTDNNGRARNRWVLVGTNGAVQPSGIAKRMVATAAGVGEVEFQARVYPGRMCSVTQNASVSSPAVGSAVSVTATVKDCNGYGIPGATVTFTAGSGSVTSPVTTDASGLAATSWTAGTVPGVQTLVASASAKAAPYSAGGDPTYTVTTTRFETVVAGAPASVTVVGVPPLTAATSSTVTITVIVKDFFGNVVPTTSVSFAASGGGVAPATPGSVSSAAATTGSGGTASVVWTMGSSAVLNTLTITAGGAVTSVSITGF